MQRADFPVVEFTRGTDAFLFAESAESDCFISLFDPDWLKESATLHTKEVAGRGSVVVFDHENHSLVLREYRRGGMMSRLNKDQYYWRGLAATRPWQEFMMLRTLVQLRLPVPAPYACRISRTGLMYRGSLITHLIPDTETLASTLTHREVSEPEWFNIGRCIRRFHDAGAFHSDLNAHNILLNKNSEIFLIDFDKSGFRTGHGRPWKFANLKRLQRSIMKCWTKSDLVFFSPQSWGTLRDGYLSTD